MAFSQKRELYLKIHSYLSEHYSKKEILYSCKPFGGTTIIDNYIEKFGVIIRIQHPSACHFILWNIKPYDRMCKGNTPFEFEGVKYTIVVESGFNKEQMTYVYKENEKLPVVGTTFSKNTPFDEIISWASKILKKLKYQDTL